MKTNLGIRFDLGVSNMKHKGIHALVSILLFVGCTPFTSEGRMQDIVYTEDTRTGLCFANLYPASSQYNVTNVPCTAEVERLIK